jgi:hypothetical protein
LDGFVAFWSGTYVSFAPYSFGRNTDLWGKDALKVRLFLFSVILPLLSFKSAPFSPCSLIPSAG